MCCSISVYSESEMPVEEGVDTDLISVDEGHAPTQTDDQGPATGGGSQR